MKKHQKCIEKFKWPEDSYDCVVGVFCLCYLQGQNLKNALAGMERSIKETGYIVLMEPVLENSAEEKEKPFGEEGQKMMIRKRNWYERKL